MKFYRVAYNGEIVYLSSVKAIERRTGISYNNLMNWINKGVKPKKYDIKIKVIKTGESYDETKDN